MRYIAVFLVVLLVGFTAKAQTSEIRLRGGIATNTPFGGGKQSQIISPAFGIHYMNNEGRFIYGLGIDVYKMQLKSNTIVAVANPAVPVSFTLNYKFISKRGFYAYAGANIGAGYVFVNNTAYETIKDNSPYMGFFGGNVGATKSISKYFSLNVEYSARQSEICYNREKKYKYGFMQSIAALSLVYKF